VHQPSHTGVLVRSTFQERKLPKAALRHSPSPHHHHRRLRRHIAASSPILLNAPSFHHHHDQADLPPPHHKRRRRLSHLPPTCPRKWHYHPPSARSTVEELCSIGQRSRRSFRRPPSSPRPRPFLRAHVLSWIESVPGRE